MLATFIAAVIGGIFGGVVVSVCLVVLQWKYEEEL